MKTRIRFSLFAASLLLGNAPLYAAGTNWKLETPTDLPAEARSPAATNTEVEDAVDNLIRRSMAKMQLSKPREAEFADIFTNYDALLAQNTKTNDARLKILIEKGKLYWTLDDPINAYKVFKQVNAEYPDVVLDDNTADFLTMLKDQSERKRVRDTLTPGAPFPDFAEKDLHDKNLSISNYKGKVILVDFWATWCPPCVASMPGILKLYHRYHDQGFEVIAISLDLEKDALEKFVQQRKLPWPQHFDGNRFDGPLALKYGVNVAPTSYLLDRNGKIIKEITPADDLDMEVANALKKS
jgi:thiol-disulfide isomerase/thioredoxin